jgi:hypothetical protein
MARTHRASNWFEPFLGQRDVAVYESTNGVRTMRVRAAQWPDLFEKHTRGTQRIGLFPARGRRCRFGVLDLDAHEVGSPNRHPDGVALLDVLAQRGITAYMCTSRHQCGCHVWLFFEAPGVPTCDLYAFLEVLASELRAHGPVDVFPNAPTGKGRAILLPYFGGDVDLLDVDLKPIPRDKLEANAASVIATSKAPSWPPAHWNLGTVGNGAGPTFRTQVSRLREAGLVFQHAGALQARRGARNDIAGAIARDFVRRGRTFEDFKRWDTANVPPLASDEPENLLSWWRWALRREGRTGVFRPRVAERTRAGCNL